MKLTVIPEEKIDKPKEEEEGEKEEVSLQTKQYFLLFCFQKKFVFCDHGIVYDEGRKCSMKGPAGVAGLAKITEDEVEEIMNDYDPIEAPPGPYTVQPDKPGTEYNQ